MADLLRKPTGARGKVHDITPERAGWGYVGFSLYRLEPGDVAAEATGDREVILVLVEGKATVQAAGQDWGEMGERMDVFEKTPPHCLYLPPGADWRALGLEAAVFAPRGRLAMAGLTRLLDEAEVEGGPPAGEQVRGGLDDGRREREPPAPGQRWIRRRFRRPLPGGQPWKPASLPGGGSFPRHLSWYRWTFGFTPDMPLKPLRWYR